MATSVRSSALLMAAGGRETTSVSRALTSVWAGAALDRATSFHVSTRRVLRSASGVTRSAKLSARTTWVARHVFRLFMAAAASLFLQQKRTLNSHPSVVITGDLDYMFSDVVILPLLLLSAQHSRRWLATNAGISRTDSDALRLARTTSTQTTVASVSPATATATAGAQEAKTPSDQEDASRANLSYLTCRTMSQAALMSRQTAATVFTKRPFTTIRPKSWLESRQARRHSCHLYFFKWHLLLIAVWSKRQRKSWSHRRYFLNSEFGFCS